MEHNYTNSVKKQINSTKKKGTERLRQSAMSAIMDNTPQTFDFAADAYLIRDMHKNQLASTGMRMMQSMQDS